MALTKCGECGHQISTSAAACPACGAPPPATKGGAVVTTQATAKRFKGLQLAGVLVMSAGTVSCVAQKIEASIALWAVGAVVYTYARFSAWWNHG